MPEEYIAQAAQHAGNSQKRLRDREAQRTHRSRQRKYVELLEAQLKLLMNQPKNTIAAELWADNERLRQQVCLLHDQLPAINAKS
jgi:hypothetical protein